MDLNSNQEAVVGRSFCNPVPMDIVQSWLKGEYLVGQSEAAGYDYIGWSLMVRGHYGYVVTSDPTTNELKEEIVSRFEQGFMVKQGTKKLAISHGGIAFIDIQDGELHYQGVRLFSNCVMYNKSSEADAPLFWKSMFSNLTRINKDGDPHLYFGQVLYEPQADEAYRTVIEALAKKFEPGNAKDCLVHGFLTQHRAFEPVCSSAVSEDQMLKFRESASKYLSEEYEENLTVVVSGAKAEDADDVSGLVHIKLEKWMLQNLEGELQTVTLKDDWLPKNKGEIWWFPL